MIWNWGQGLKVTFSNIKIGIKTFKLLIINNYKLILKYSFKWLVLNIKLKLH